jgi:transmembrane sensor
MKSDADRADADLALSDAAIEWVVRLKSGRATSEDEAAFQAWRSQSAAHEAAAHEAGLLWHGVGVAGDQFRTNARKNAYTKLTRRTILGGAGLVLVGAGLKATGVLGPHLFADFVTSVGEQRTVELADGSSIVLNGNTALSADLNTMRRELTLHQGEATFTVKPDPARPFVVGANGGQVRAVGTVFDVDIRATETAVTVLDGKVSVTTSMPSTGSVNARANQRIKYTPTGGASPAEVVDAAVETAWRRGKLIFNARPLSDVVAEIQRHRRGTIVLASSRLRNLEVTGVFEINDPESILRTIDETLDVSVTRLPLVTILR